MRQLPTGICKRLLHWSLLHRSSWRSKTNQRRIIHNYLPKGRWIVADIYRDVKHRGIILYPSLLTDPEGDSCFSIYQIRWIKNTVSLMATISSSETFAKWRATFSLRSQNSEYPRIVQVTGANQNARKLLSTNLVNTNNNYDHVT